MPITLKMTVDTAKLNAALMANGEKWAKAVDYTLSDMGQRAPSKLAKIGAKTYNIGPSQLNPRNKRSKGSVSVSGGIKDFALTYKGEKLSLARFPFKPKAPKQSNGQRLAAGKKARKRKQESYVIMAEILRGKPAKVGHWNPPHSEGGKYSGKSPWFNAPGVPAPVMRIGSKLGDSMKALAVPQMVVSDRTKHEATLTLNQLLDQRLTHNLRRAGLS